MLKYINYRKFIIVLFEIVIFDILERVLLLINAGKCMKTESYYIVIPISEMLNRLKLL